MSAYPSLPLFTDAFIADTGHMTAQETGAYLMLLMMAWRMSDCRLPDDDTKLARWARVDLRTWRRIKPSVMGFWTLTDAGWHQKRLLKEREIVSKRAEVARENGKQGGRPKSLENQEEQNPAGSSRVTQEKAPNPNPIQTLEETSSSNGAGAARDALGDDPAKALFDPAVINFVEERSTAKNAQAARALIGKWKATAKNDAAVVLALLRQARVTGVMDLPSWMPKAIEARQRQIGALKSGQPIITQHGEPDALGRKPGHPSYGCRMAI